MDGKISGVRYCEVISVDDENGADRIKVRLIPEDNNIKSDNDLEYAFPLLPKMLHVKPKKGEGVLVLLAISNDGNSQRYYIGPVISQSHRINEDKYFMGGDSFFRGAYKKLDPPLTMKPEANGTLPENEDISILGRKNCDIQIKEDDIRIKAGVRVMNDKNKYEVSFNKKNPAYIKLKYHTFPLNDNTYSTATIVGDKINLISTSSSEKSYQLCNTDDLITDETLNNLIYSAYKLPYGEKLVDFLITFVNAFACHTHNFPNLPPNPAFLTTLQSQKATLLDNKGLLSNTVRIN